MSLTLLSLWLTSSWQKQLAAARIAVGACAAQSLSERAPCVELLRVVSVGWTKCQQ